FKGYKRKINAAVGNERTATLLSQSLFILSQGSNDLIAYFSTPLRSVDYDIRAYTDLMLESASNFIQELYALGARVCGVNIPPIGCVPVERTLNGGIKKACYETANQAAMLFDSKLSGLIDSLNKRLPEAQLIYVDLYNPLLSMIQDPARYGFEVVDIGCYGTRTIELGICNDASKYIFWDPRSSHRNSLQNPHLCDIKAS
uniref:GDSL esterase/lipase EXL3-like n=1 Tax=Fragaria vesca subsp. vesca TaxID=101020 RepID=UPI0005CAC3FA